MEPGNFFYANAVEFAMSIYDVSLRFVRNGAAPGLPPTSNAKVVRLGDFTISMSPSHAKAMLPPLVKAIAEYERANGKIPVEAKDQAAWEELTRKP